MNDRGPAALDIPPVTIGEHCEQRVTFDAETIRAFAEICGDFNPLHHDEERAARSRFGTIIASGPHVAARMMGLEATYFSGRHQPLGLENSFRFVRAVPAGTTLTLAWTVTSVAHKPSLRGHVVGIEGRAIDDAGVVYLSGHASLLLRPKVDSAEGDA